MMFNGRGKHSVDYAAPFAKRCLLLMLASGTTSPLAAALEAAPPGGPAAQTDAADTEKPLSEVGEKVIPAESAPNNSPLQARESDSFYRLSHPRIERGPKPWPVLIVDYERVHSSAHNGQTLVVRSADGHVRNWILIAPFAENNGKIEIDLHIGGPFDPGPPKDAELYLVRQDNRYGQWTPTFKVSNSAVIGTMKEVTLSRKWTPAETDQLHRPPPDYTNPDAHPNLGHDTEFAGGKGGGLTSRFVSPDHPLLGLEFRIGEWDQEKCLAQLVPVFAADQPVTVEPRIIAKTGYAVGAVNVRAKRFVDGLQLVYFKIKPDGALDPADHYESDWFGAPGQGDAIKLGGDGKRIIGINCRHGAILDGLALVSDALQK